MEGARRPTETSLGFNRVAGEERTKNGWGGEERRVREREMGGRGKGAAKEDASPYYGSKRSM